MGVVIAHAENPDAAMLAEEVVVLLRPEHVVGQGVLT
jgi:hypothetical protein